MARNLDLDEPPRVPERRFALFDLGFRPFYLLASVFAALSVPLWALQFSGLLKHAYLAGPLWHAHEMVFGYTLAVIVGFLFTAARNWTNLPTPTGWRLALLAGLWIAARILVLTPYALAAGIVDVAFPLAAAVALAVPFFKAKNRRNYFFVALLSLFAVTDALVHAQRMGVTTALPWVGVQTSLDIVLFVVVVMAGRVIPMFTNNGVPGAGAVRRPFVERLSLGSVLALALMDAFGTRGIALSGVLLAALVGHAWRWLLWRPWKTLRTPLVWVLHVGYAWIPVHLALRMLAEGGFVASSLATHALTVGTVGGLTLGMMTRTARGHTARPLRADRYETACYVLVFVSAVVRVAGPALAASRMVDAILVSATLWSAAFALYAVRYWPVLTRPRLDGRPG